MAQPMFWMAPNFTARLRKPYPGYQRPEEGLVPGVRKPRTLVTCLECGFRPIRSEKSKPQSRHERPFDFFFSVKTQIKPLSLLTRNITTPYLENIVKLEQTNRQLVEILRTSSKTLVVMRANEFWREVFSPVIGQKTMNIPGIFQAFLGFSQPGCNVGPLTH